MSKEWFILQFKSNSHHQASKNLNRQGFETFLPLHDTTSRKLSRFISTAKSDWHKINNTYGVSCLITFNSILKSIPTIFVDSLIKRYDLSGKLLPIQKLKKGDQVKLLKGPFANFAATIEKYEDDQRIWVLIDLMGRKSKLQTETESLQLSD